MTTKNKNPFIEPQNYYEGYQKSVEELKKRPEIVEFGRLCYEVFETYEPGKRLMELLLEKYVLPSIVNNNAPNYDIACVYAEGFKEAYRLLLRSVKTHENYIRAETNK